MWIAPALCDYIKFVGQIHRESNLPQYDFLPGSGLEYWSIARGREFNSDSFRLVSTLVKNHLGDCGRGANTEVRSLKHLRGEIGVLCGDSAPPWVDEVHYHNSKYDDEKR